jgi:large subunit ribosomal protein L14e
MVFDIGRVCVKLAGRDAGKKCVIVEILENGYVLVDGETRRRKCNILHLEPTKNTVGISSKASHDEVCKALDIEVNKGKPKKAAARPKKQRKTVAKPAPAAKSAANAAPKAPAKKAAPKAAEKTA